MWEDFRLLSFLTLIKRTMTLHFRSMEDVHLQQEFEDNLPNKFIWSILQTHFGKYLYKISNDFTLFPACSLPGSILINVFQKHGTSKLRDQRNPIIIIMYTWIFVEVECKSYIHV